jgi:uncharacterized membrane protein YecN with MAPEG domain
MNVGIICTAVLGLLLFGLGLYVSAMRGRTGRNIGFDAGAIDPLHRAVRAHGNTAEYAPFFAVLFLWFAMHPGPAWVSIAIVLATAARVLIVAGLLWGGSLDKPNPMRFLGALLTYVTGIALAIRLALG